MSIPVSVIIPCYRCVDTIARALDSVRRQTSLPREVWLIDDCSDDHGKTLAELRRLRQLYQDVFEIGIIEGERNVGAGEARNAGWARASQACVAFLDADDTWHPDKLRLQYQWMEAHPEVVMSGHQTACLAPGMPLPAISEALVARQIHCSELQLHNRFPTRSVMLRRAVTFRFAPGKRHAEDYLLWLQIVCTGGQAWLIQSTLAYSHRPDLVGGLSGQLWAMEKGELDAYNSARREGLLSNARFVLLASYSLLKFLRRLIWRGMTSAGRGAQQ